MEKKFNNVDLKNVVENNQILNFLSEISKKMINDLKNFDVNSNNIIKSANNEFQNKFLNFMQFIGEYKKNIENLKTDDNERMKKIQILKELRNKIIN
jgi:hypothetical protein